MNENDYDFDWDKSHPPAPVERRRSKDAAEATLKRGHGTLR